MKSSQRSLTLTLTITPDPIPDGSAATGTVTRDGDLRVGQLYSILGGNSSGAFAIDQKTGQITVASRTALNGMTSSFFLTVQVEDPDGLTATAVVRVNIK